MKAALLTAVNAPLELAEVEPLPLGFGQVLVKVLASGICGAQLQEIRGEKGTHFPRLMGHEGAGIVQQTGVGVSRIKAGDKVVMHWRVGAGIESDFPAYRHKGASITSGKVTTFSEQSVCSENRLTAVPSDTPNELCALLGCGLSTALSTIENEAALKMGESILIIGCGGLGANLIRAAKMRQAACIAVVDIHANKEAMALGLGATAFFRGPLPIGYHFDAVVDTTGHRYAIENGLERLAPGGRFVMVGQPKPSEGITLHNARHMFDGTGKSIRATQGGGFKPEVDVPRYVAMHKAGILDLSGIITDRIPLDDINRGLDLVRNGQASRVLIEMR